MATKLRRISYGKGQRWVVRCACGTEVFCTQFTNTCETCHSDYGMSGDPLAPRSQWGEETGEQPSDCVGHFDSNVLDEDF